MATAGGIGGRVFYAGRIMARFRQTCELCDYVPKGRGVEIGYALAQCRRRNLVASDFAVADRDVDRDVVMKLTYQILRCGYHVGFEPRGRIGDARVPDQIDFQVAI